MININQLLAEIEQRGYRWLLQGTKGNYYCALQYPDECICWEGVFEHAEDAAGEALLRILMGREES